MYAAHFGAISETGDFRKENQDCILCEDSIYGFPESGLFLVADGMGGLSRGAEVSQLIARHFSAWWNREFPEMCSGNTLSGEDIKELLEQEIWDINSRVLEERKKTGEKSGSTLSLLMFFDGNYYIENLGDSRIYLLRNHVFRLLTEDQSIVANLVRTGRMTEEEAECSPQKNILTMCIGMFNTPDSFYTDGRIRKGDSFLLCSDGLYNVLGNEQMQNILEDDKSSPQQKSERLRSLIPCGDAKDNVSAIVVEVE